jgi:GNAT superfamily N-acetyltransferase
MERVFLIAPVNAILIAEPTVESRVISDDDLSDVAHLVVDAAAGLPGPVINYDDSLAVLHSLRSGANGEPLREGWLGIWEGYGLPASAILTTTWRGMPCIAQILTAPAARNRGFASSLIREVAQVVERNGGTHIGITLDEGSPATSLLSELGFVEMFSPAGL